MSEEDTLERLECAIESRIKTVKKPKDVFDAKALVALYDRLPKTKQKYHDDLIKKATQIIESLDEVTRVFVAEVLREECYIAPTECDNDVLCNYCDIARDEMCTDECTCDIERLEVFADAIGAHI